MWTAYKHIFNSEPSQIPGLANDIGHARPIATMPSLSPGWRTICRSSGDTSSFRQELGDIPGLEPQPERTLWGLIGWHLECRNRSWRTEARSSKKGIVFVRGYYAYMDF